MKELVSNFSGCQWGPSEDKGASIRLNTKVTIYDIQIESQPNNTVPDYLLLVDTYVTIQQF